MPQAFGSHTRLALQRSVTEGRLLQDHELSALKLVSSYSSLPKLISQKRTAAFNGRRPAVDQLSWNQEYEGYRQRVCKELEVRERAGEDECC